MSYITGCGYLYCYNGGRKQCSGSYAYCRCRSGYSGRQCNKGRKYLCRVLSFKESFCSRRPEIQFLIILICFYQLYAQALCAKMAEEDTAEADMHIANVVLVTMATVARKVEMYLKCLTSVLFCLFLSAYFPSALSVCSVLFCFVLFCSAALLLVSVLFCSASALFSSVLYMFC